MPEVLEIQIKDKGGSPASGPPRPPAGAFAAAPPAGADAPLLRQQASIQAPPAEAKHHEAITEILDHLGLGKLYKAMTQLLGVAPKAPSPPPRLPPSPPAPAPAKAVPPAPIAPTPPRPAREVIEVPAAPPPQSPRLPTVEAGTPQPPRMERMEPPGRDEPQPPRIEKIETPKANAPQPPRLPEVKPAQPTPPKLPTPPAPKAPLAPPKAPAVPAGNASAVAGAEGAASAAAGGIEAAAGALGGIAAAAAPVGAALVVADVAAKGVAKTFDAMRHGVEFFGKQVSLAAGNDYLGMFKQGLEAVHHPLKDLPIVGQMYEAQVQAAIAPIKEFTSVVEAFNRRAKQLTGFSPELAYSQANASVRSLMADMKEAEELGPSLARMIDAEADIKGTLRELLLPMKKVVVEVLADVLEELADFMTTVKGGVAGTEETLKIQLELFNDVFGSGHVKDIPDLLKKTPERIAKAIHEAQAAPKPDEAEGWLRELYKQHGREPAAPGDNGAAFNPRPNIPLVNQFNDL